jgi:hypothetical protein
MTEITMTHELKIKKEYFSAVATGKKTFEVRINDRNFKEEDLVILREFEGEEYTGRSILRKIGYVYLFVGGKYCVFSLLEVPPTCGST